MHSIHAQHACLASTHQYIACMHNIHICQQVINNSSTRHITKWLHNGRIWCIDDESEAKWYAHSFVDVPGLSKWIFRWAFEDLPACIWYFCWQLFKRCRTAKSPIPFYVKNTLVPNLISMFMIQSASAHSAGPILLVCWFVGLLACWFVCLLACWYVGLLVCWLVGLCSVVRKSIAKSMLKSG